MCVLDGSVPVKLKLHQAVQHSGGHGGNVIIMMALSLVNKGVFMTGFPVFTYSVCIMFHSVVKSAVTSCHYGYQLKLCSSDK